MYGIYKNKVAINNVDPVYGDGQLKLDDNTWGWGGTLALLYEINPGTRIGLTWTSEVDLDFKSNADFFGLASGLERLLDNRGPLDSTIDVGIKAPQQVMGSLFAQVNPSWAVLASIGWQEWSKFGQVQLSIDDTADPKSLTTNLDFKDTWHFALGAQFRLNDPWQLNFGVAYDTAFQDGSDVSPLMPVNSAWRFGIGAQQQLGRSSLWGLAAEYLYGGSLDTSLQSTPVALGGRGDLNGSYDDLGTIFVAAYYSWQF